VDEQPLQLPVPKFSHDRFRRALLVDQVVIVVIPITIVVNVWVFLLLMAISIPFWLHHSPTIYLLRHTQWMRAWAVLNCGLGLLCSLALRFYPETRGFIAPVMACSIGLTYLLFSRERRHYEYLLFGKGSPDEWDQELDTTRVNDSKDAPWGSANQLMVDALEVCQTHPTEGMQKLRNIAKQGVNVNACDSDGRTILSHALYMESSPSIVGLLKKMGATP